MYVSLCLCVCARVCMSLCVCVCRLSVSSSLHLSAFALERGSEKELDQILNVGRRRLPVSDVFGGLSVSGQ